MKNYFSFHLTGRKFFPVWILFMILFFSPYAAMIFSIKDIQPGSHTFLVIFPVMILLTFIALVFSFYIAKLTIEGIGFRDKTLIFSGSFGSYIGTILLGMLLSIITLGIYMAWFITDLHRFFIDHTSYDSQEFRFRGRGGKLFVIFMLAVFIPVIIMTSVMAVFIVTYGPTRMAPFIFLEQVATAVIMIPYLYLMYKWMVNVDYKDYHIAWQTAFWPSCGKIAGELALAIITLGIYMPLAMLRLYKYFTERTLVASGDKILRPGYDIEPLDDFLAIWGQMLLAIITLGIYYPWAFCNIYKRVLGKTYLEIPEVV